MSVHVYLIDDDRDYVTLLKRELESLSMIERVSAFMTGEDALAHLVDLIEGRRPASEFPHVIILDLHLPGESGLQILQRLKNCDMTKKIPVIINTASEERSDRLEAYKEGGAVFCVKQGDNAFLMEVFKQLKLTGRI